MTELKMEHVLILAIVAFVLYHFVDRCSCNGFSIGIEPFIYTTPGSTNIHYATNLPHNHDYFIWHNDEQNLEVAVILVELYHENNDGILLFLNHQVL